MKQKDYLLDTNIILYIHELEAGGQSSECQALKTRLESLPQNARIFLSPVTVGEVEYGIRVGPFDDPDKKKYKKLVKILKSYPCLGIDCDIARQYYSSCGQGFMKNTRPNEKKDNPPKKDGLRSGKIPQHQKNFKYRKMTCGFLPLLGHII